MKLVKSNQYGRRPLPKIKHFLTKMVQMRGYFLMTCINDIHEDKNIKQMRRYSQETGRSMVEMLGVLAIIGVLSVGGIAGYSKAMFKHNANKTMDIISHAVTRIAELDTMNLGQEIGGAQDARKFGIIPDCNINYVDINGDTGEHCPLPLGEFWLGFGSANNVLFGEFGIDFIQEPFDSCVMFFHSDIYKYTPEEWWLPGNFEQDNSYNGGFIEVFAGVNYERVYGKSPDSIERGAKSILSNTDILKACEPCKNSEYCRIYWAIRGEI